MYILIPFINQNLPRLVTVLSRLKELQLLHSYILRYLNAVQCVHSRDWGKWETIFGPQCVLSVISHNFTEHNII